MRIFVKCHLLDSFDALATNTQNFSRKVDTERSREISRTGREIWCSPKHPKMWTLAFCCPKRLLK